MAMVLTVGSAVTTLALLHSYRSKQQKEKLRQEAVEGTLQTDAWSCIAAQYTDLQDRAHLRTICKAARRLEIKLDATCVAGAVCTVRLVGCRLGPSGVGLVVHSLGRPGNAAVTALELHSCRLGIEGAIVLAAGLRADPWLLRSLSISEDNLQEQGVEVLLQAVGRSWCSKLVLDEVGLGDGAARRAADLIRTSDTLERLSLCYNGIGTLGMAALGEAIVTNHSLTHVDLRGNRCGNVGVIALADAIAVGEREAADAAAKTAADAGEDAEGSPFAEESEGPAMLRLELGDNDVDLETRRRVGLLLLEAAGDAGPKAARIAVPEF